MVLSPAELATYALVVLALQVVPGPAVLLTLGRSVSGGAKIGMATGLGIAVGDICHTAMASLGLSAILITSTIAFEIVKYLGVVYLAYLGITALRSRSDNRLPFTYSLTVGKAFRQAILVEVINPKTALFFLSFLPQFVHPDRGDATFQLFTLGSVFVLLSIIVTSTYALCAAVLAKWMGNSEAVARWRNRFVGGVYLALCVHLAVASHKN